MFPMTLDSFEFNGTAHMKSHECNVWVNVSVQYNYTNTYTFFTDVHDNMPVRLEMFGYDFIFGSHPDHYIFDYHYYRPGPIPSNVFDIPSFCKNLTANSNSSGPSVKALRSLVQLSRLHPEAHPMADEMREFAQTHGKWYKNSMEVLNRTAIYQVC